MAAAGGADAPFGVSCTPAARPRRATQKNVGDLFVIYQKEYDEWKSFIAWWVGMGKPELRYDVADPTKFVSILPWAENE